MPPERGLSADSLSSNEDVDDESIPQEGVPAVLETRYRASRNATEARQLVEKQPAARQDAWLECIVPAPRLTTVASAPTTLLTTKVRPLQLPPAPVCFLCPISRQIMDEPVIAADGVAYDKEHILAHFRSGGRRSPSTQALLTSLEVHASAQLKEAIHGYVALCQQAEQQWDDLATDFKRIVKQRAETTRSTAMRRPLDFKHVGYDGFGSSLGGGGGGRGDPNELLAPRSALLNLSAVSRVPQPMATPRLPVPVPPVDLQKAGLDRGCPDRGCPYKSGPAPRSARGERVDRVRSNGETMEVQTPKTPNFFDSLQGLTPRLQLMRPPFMGGGR